MRNILVFPDGTKHPFMYPNNREVEVGTPLQTILADRVEILKVSRIVKTEKEIYYHLSLS